MSAFRPPKPMLSDTLHLGLGSLMEALLLSPPQRWGFLWEAELGARARRGCLGKRECCLEEEGCSGCF